MLRRYFQKLHLVGGIAVCAAYREFPDVSRSVYLSGARAYSRDELPAIPAAVFMARFYLRVSRSDQRQIVGFMYRIYIDSTCSEVDFVR